MKRIAISILLAAFSLMIPRGVPAQKKGDEGSTKEVYTGTLINMNGRSISTGFNLTITGRTTETEAQQYREILGSQGQDDLLKAIHKNNLGYIAATGQTRRNLLVVREGQIEGSRRIIAVFERWMGFFEVRGGYRSMDHPYSIIEIVFDHKGRGTGTFVGLAQVRMKKDKKTEQLRLEIENFGSFPAKVMGVMRRN